MTCRSRFFIVFAAAATAIVLMARGVNGYEPVARGDSDPALQAFYARVEAYAALHQQLEPSPASLDTSGLLSRLVASRYLASAIRSSRCDAQQGDIFTSDVTVLFRDLVAESIGERDGEEFVAELGHGEVVPHGIHPTVNEPYSMTTLYRLPFDVRLGLPPLPAELDYRVAAYDLVLWDVEAGIVVDFVPDAFVTWTVTE